jgi:hypothetical protein
MNKLHLPVNSPNTFVSMLILLAIIGCLASLWLVVLPDRNAIASPNAAPASPMDLPCPIPLPDARSVQSKDVAPMEMLLSFDFLAFFTILLVGLGSGIMMLTNAGQVLPAFRGSHSVDYIPTFVAVLSVANCFGRLFAGNVSSYMRSRPVLQEMFQNI